LSFVWPGLGFASTSIFGFKFGDRFALACRSPIECMSLLVLLMVRRPIYLSSVSVTFHSLESSSQFLFVIFCRYKACEAKMRELAKDAFKECDLNNNGTIEPMEVAHLVGILTGKPLEDPEDLVTGRCCTGFLSRALAVFECACFNDGTNRDICSREQVIQ